MDNLSQGFSCEVAVLLLLEVCEGCLEGLVLGVLVLGIVVDANQFLSHISFGWPNFHTV